MGYSKYMSNIASSRTQARGFTLIELLVVIAIIGILSSVVLASLNTARQKGADAAIKSNMSDARAQAELYYDDHSPNTYASVCTTASGGIANQMAAAASNAGTPAPVHNTAGGANVSVCNDSSAGWAAQIPLKSTSGYFCVDSSGQALVISASKLTTGSIVKCS